MDLTLTQLRAIIPLAGLRACIFLAPLNAAMGEFGISEPAQQAAFLAQLAHESGSLVYVREIASGAQYEGRADLGNNRPGDGMRFKGRGLIQITGRANYARASSALFGDQRLLTAPEMLEQPLEACRSAGWYWQSRGLNKLSDPADFKALTRAINGGYNGLVARQDFYDRARGALGLA